MFVCCPCHGVIQPLFRAKQLLGADPSAWAGVCFGLSFKAWLPARLSLSHRSLSLKQGKISPRAPPLMAQLNFCCSRASTSPPSVPLPTSLTVDSLCLGYTGPSMEKPADHRSPDALCTALFPRIHELYCNRDTEDQGRGLALNPKDLF